MTTAPTVFKKRRISDGKSVEIDSYEPCIAKEHLFSEDLVATDFNMSFEYITVTLAGCKLDL